LAVGGNQKAEALTVSLRRSYPCRHARAHPDLRRPSALSAGAPKTLVYCIQGLVALPTAARGSLFTVPLFLLLIVTNLCVLELPPYRFLHFMTGIVVFSGFFIGGPAILGLL